MSIGANIKKLRLQHDMSQQDLARIAGVTDKAVSSWENDVKTPRMGAIQKIADYFNIKKSDIIEGIKDCGYQPAELKEAVANLNKAIGELANNYDPWQVDKVADAMEKYFAVVNKYEPPIAIIMLESVYLGALLCGCRRNGEIANRFMAIRNRYAKQLELVKDKEVWE